ncbi:aquaporin Z [Nocardioides aurantiacus]|uniref:MIP family channel protein n=1 Tax=Nocardioides aurantiacus TaxID=86796 RepID=A0A3N2CS62_9ACTN|nr:aquaporin Z [Nocardioides aurantiacus]ROR90365.1 MIP family channel protein [Nocardioides aurantiacus]
MTRRHPTRPLATPRLSRRLAAEAFGTFVLVLGGCGAAVLAGDAIGNAGIAAAFGLSVLTAAFAVGHVSGGHFNPAVSLGAAVAGRLPWRSVPAYVVTQVVAAIAAAGVLLVVATGRPGFDLAEGFATNGFGDASPAGYAWWAAALAEVVLTALFVWTILGVTDARAPQAFTPLAIGLSLTLIHLVSIPVDNTSVNPARSIGPALVAGGTAGEQLWLFVLAPMVGAVLAGLTYAPVFGRQPSEEPTAAAATT